MQQNFLPSCNQDIVCLHSLTQNHGILNPVGYHTNSGGLNLVNCIPTECCTFPRINIAHFLIFSEILTAATLPHGQTAQNNSLTHIRAEPILKSYKRAHLTCIAFQQVEAIKKASIFKA